MDVKDIDAGLKVHLILVHFICLIHFQESD